MITRYQYQNVTETRIFNLSSHFREVYQNLRQRLRNEQLQLIRHQAFADLAAGTLSITVTGIVMAIMVWRALQAQISLGDLTLLYQAFNQGQSLIKNLLSNTGKIYFNSLFIENLKIMSQANNLGNLSLFVDKIIIKLF